MNIDKIKAQIGEIIFNHINSLNKEQLEDMADACFNEINRYERMITSYTETKQARLNQLRTELNYINYKLEL